MPTPPAPATNSTPTVSVERARCRSTCRRASPLSTRDSGRSAQVTTPAQRLQHQRQQQDHPDQQHDAGRRSPRPSGRKPRMDSEIRIAADQREDRAQLRCRCAARRPRSSRDTRSMPSSGETSPARQAGTKAPSSDMPSPNTTANTNGQPRELHGRQGHLQQVATASGSGRTRPAGPCRCRSTVPTIPATRLSRRPTSMIWLLVAPMARRIDSCRRRSLTFIMNVFRMMNAASSSVQAVVICRPFSLENSVSCIAVRADGRRMDADAGRQDRRDPRRQRRPAPRLARRRRSGSNSIWPLPCEPGLGGVDRQQDQPGMLQGAGAAQLQQSDDLIDCGLSARLGQQLHLVADLHLQPPGDRIRPAAVPCRPGAGGLP